MALHQTAADLVAAANRTALSVDALTASRLVSAAQVQLVDIRELPELQAGGMASGAIHLPRGLLEFAVDPSSPWAHPVLSTTALPLLLYCGIGARSALACQTLARMGVSNAGHIAGGVAAMQAAGMVFARLPDQSVG